MEPVFDHPCGRVDVKVHAYLTSALDGALERNTLRPLCPCGVGSGDGTRNTQGIEPRSSSL
jgi:hypothetical protein